jgi:hypothetical protein
MKRVSVNSSCFVVWCGARAACAEVSPGSVEALKAKHGQKVHMEQQGPYHGLDIYVEEYAIYLGNMWRRRQWDQCGTSPDRRGDGGG